MNKAFLFFVLLASFKLYAQLPVGTYERPIPLVGVTNSVPYTIYLYNDNAFRVLNGASEIFEGQWNLSDDVIMLSPHGYARKIYLSVNKMNYLCLEAFFYRGPSEYRWQREIYCPR